jgi:hypothetical protein
LEEHGGVSFSEERDSTALEEKAQTASSERRRCTRDWSSDNTVRETEKAALLHAGQ